LEEVLTMSIRLVSKTSMQLSERKEELACNAIQFDSIFLAKPSAALHCFLARLAIIANAASPQASPMIGSKVAIGKGVSVGIDEIGRR